MTLVLIVLWFDITLTHIYTHRTCTKTNRPRNIKKYILTPPFMCSQQLSVLQWTSNSLLWKIPCAAGLQGGLYFSRIIPVQNSQISRLVWIWISTSWEIQKRSIEIVWINNTYKNKKTEKVRKDENIWYLHFLEQHPSVFIVKFCSLPFREISTPTVIKWGMEVTKNIITTAILI